MAERKRTDEDDQRRESGLPGGGAGRKDEVGGSGVYPWSGPHPPGDAPLVNPGSWGQGARGGAGYEDHGESEIYMIGVRPEKCRDLMTKDPVCCLPGDSAAEAAERMRQYDIGVIPVVQDQASKKLAGIVTDRDLALKVVAEGRDPNSVSVGEVMSRDVVCCSPDDDYERALHLMEQHRIRRIPEVDNSGRVVGIISQSDVALRIRDAAKTAELVESVSQPR
jgi:CBS domain-containing protein